MIILKSLIHDQATNWVEATWVNENDFQIKCHSYADVQMDMLRADAAELGTSLDDYVDTIAKVEAGIKPIQPYTLSISERRSAIQSKLSVLDTKRIRPMAEGDTEFLAKLNAEAITLREELAKLNS